jgi:hypothetical protein
VVVVVIDDGSSSSSSNNSSRNYNNTPSKLAEAATPLTCIREVAGSNLGWDNGGSPLPVLSAHHTLRAENLKPRSQTGS